MATKFVFNPLTGNFDLINISSGGAANSVLTVTTTLVPATVSPVALIALPVGTVVDKIKVAVDTPFDGTGATLTVGKSGLVDKYIDVTENDLYTSGSYEADHANVAISGSSENVIVTFSAGTASVGSARVLLYYTIPTIV